MKIQRKPFELSQNMNMLHLYMCKDEQLITCLGVLSVRFFAVSNK